MSERGGLKATKAPVLDGKLGKHSARTKILSNPFQALPKPNHCTLMDKR